MTKEIKKENWDCVKDGFFKWWTWDNGCLDENGLIEPSTKELMKEATLYNSIDNHDWDDIGDVIEEVCNKCKNKLIEQGVFKNGK